MMTMYKLYQSIGVKVAEYYPESRMICYLQNKRTKEYFRLTGTHLIYEDNIWFLIDGPSLIPIMETLCVNIFTEQPLADVERAR